MIKCIAESFIPIWLCSSSQKGSVSSSWRNKAALVLPALVPCASHAPSWRVYNGTQKEYSKRQRAHRNECLPSPQQPPNNPDTIRVFAAIYNPAPEHLVPQSGLAYIHASRSTCLSSVAAPPPTHTTVSQRPSLYYNPLIPIISCPLKTTTRHPRAPTLRDSSRAGRPRRMHFRRCIHHLGTNTRCMRHLGRRTSRGRRTRERGT